MIILLSFSKLALLGQSRLREIFLKTDNVIGGRYLAEITQEVFCCCPLTSYSLFSCLGNE